MNVRVRQIYVSDRPMFNRQIHVKLLHWYLSDRYTCETGKHLTGMCQTGTCETGKHLTGMCQTGTYQTGKHLTGMSSWYVSDR